MADLVQWTWWNFVCSTCCRLFYSGAKSLAELPTEVKCPWCDHVEQLNRPAV
ncbi:MAG: hypothetical protein V1846_01775 [Candidatus Komeilibacteria bacterium]